MFGYLLKSRRRNEILGGGENLKQQNKLTEGKEIFKKTYLIDNDYGLEVWKTNDFDIFIQIL